jgi:hypothetical protein
MAAIYSMHVHTRVDAYHTCASPGKLLLVVHSHALQVYKLGRRCEYTSVLYPRNYPAKVQT